MNRKVIEAQRRVCTFRYRGEGDGALQFRKFSQNYEIQKSWVQFISFLTLADFWFNLGKNW